MERISDTGFMILNGILLQDKKIESDETEISTRESAPSSVYFLNNY